MQASDIPTLISEYFAKNTSGSFIRTVPGTTTTPGAASFDQGFPSECFTDPNAGGFPPDGRDFNYLHQFETRWLQWLQAGGAPAQYNSTFQTAIGGYPNGAVVTSLLFPSTHWRSTADNNVTNPDAAGAGWVNDDPVNANQVKLVYISGSQIALIPDGGRYVTVAGANIALTSVSGVTSGHTTVLVNNASGNLAASTAYYVSIYWTGAALALAFWAVGTYSRLSDTTAINLGNQVIANGGSPISGHTLVGIIRTDGAGAFVPSSSGGLLSWFSNDIVPLTVSASNVGFSNDSVEAEISVAFRITFVTFSSRGISASCDGVRFNNLSSTSGSDLLQLSTDGALTGSLGGGYVSGSPGQGGNFESSWNGSLADGTHYITLFGIVSTGSVGTINQGYTRVNLRG